MINSTNSRFDYIINLKKLSNDARIPHRNCFGDAGYDLYSIEDKVIPAKNRSLIRTGISIAISPDIYGRIAPRSGLAYKNGIDVFAGVIDAGYRGEIGVILYNSDDADCTVEKGDRIAQIIFEKKFEVMFCEVSSLEDLFDNLEKTRASGGFGSSGV